jgi:hypothetical protein
MSTPLLNYRDSDAPFENEPNALRVELNASSDLAETFRNATEVTDHLNRDKAITPSVFAQLDRSLSKLAFTIAGENIPLTAENVVDERNHQTLRILNDVVLHHDLTEIGMLTFLTDDAARIIAVTAAEIDLGRLTVLTDEQAVILSTTQADSIDLWNLTSVTEKQVEHLSFFKGRFFGLGNVLTLSGAQVDSISRMYVNTLGLNGIETLTDDQMLKLVTFRGNYINLSNISRLSDKQAAALGNAATGRSDDGCAFYLEGLEDVTEKQAKLLLPNRKNIESAVAQTAINKISKNK